MKTVILQGLAGVHTTVTVRESGDVLPGRVYFPGVATERAKELAAIVRAVVGPIAQGLIVEICPLPSPVPPSADLAIVAAVKALVTVDACRFSDAYLFGEVTRAGEVRPVRGILPALNSLHAGDSSVIPLDNEAEGQVAAWHKLHVFAAERVADIFASGEKGPSCVDATLYPRTESGANWDYNALSHLPVEVDRAILIAAAGGHHLLLTGPGGGSVTVAKRIAAVKPLMTPAEMEEVTGVHSVGGLLQNRVVQARPFRAPHHSTTEVGLCGGGAPIRPGEVSLAHHGVLLIDEATRFRPSSMRMLSSILSTGAVRIERTGEVARFPAQAHVVGTRTACPCGLRQGAPQKCKCSWAHVFGHLTSSVPGSISEPPWLTEVFSMHYALPVLEAYVRPERVPAANEVRDQIAEAWERTRCAAVPRFTAPVSASAEGLLLEAKRARGGGGNAVRAVEHMRHVAATISALDRSDTIRDEHVEEALGFLRQAIEFHEPAATVY